MQRIEPTIGDIDLDVDPVAAQRASELARSRRTSRAIRDWFITLSLFAALIAICYGAASYAGVLPEQLRFGTPKLLARLLIPLGFAITLGSQAVGSLLLFRFGFERGALALLFPGYLLIGLKRSGIYWSIMGPWCAGLLLVVIGMILLG